MTLPPKKYASHFTSSTTNRGTEAKEVEIVNTRLDMIETSSEAVDSLSGIAEGPREDAGEYVQVVVEKHRRSRRAPCRGTQTELPLHSSIPTAHLNQGAGSWVYTGAGDGGSVLLMQTPLLLTHPTARSPHLQRNVWTNNATFAVPNAQLAVTLVRTGEMIIDEIIKLQESPKTSAWKKLNPFADDSLSYDGEAERVEVWRFERAAPCMAVSSSAGGRLMNWERRAARATRTAADEALAVPRALFSIPFAVTLASVSCVLGVARDAALGALREISDGIFKPSLAAFHNALLAPLLSALGGALRAVGDAVRPVAEVLLVFTEPPARLLASFRLFHLEVQRNTPAVDDRMNVK